MKIKSKKSDLEFCETVYPLLDTQMVQDLSLYTQHNFQSRLEHCLSVAYYSYKIGEKLHLDKISMARAGLLHDLFFYVPGEVTFSSGTHLSEHPKIALANAKVLTSINDKEEDIILNHMMGAVAVRTKTKEGFFVSMVDKYTAGSEASRAAYFTLFDTKIPYLRLDNVNAIINKHIITSA